MAVKVPSRLFCQLSSICCAFRFLTANARARPKPKPNQTTRRASHRMLASTVASPVSLRVTATHHASAATCSDARRASHGVASSAFRARDSHFARTTALQPTTTATTTSFTSSPKRRYRRGGAVVVRAERETRLVSVLTSLPQRFNLYFARKSYRVTLWRGISAYFGFYLANVMTLSFGAIGINDVVAGALSVAFFETVTRIYYRRAETNKWLEFINWFKVGYCYSLIADAFKLGS